LGILNPLLELELLEVDIFRIEFLDGERSTWSRGRMKAGVKYRPS